MDFPSYPKGEDEKRIVYVRAISALDLPEQVRAQTNGASELYSIHGEDGEFLGLVDDRDRAFLIARMNEMSPVSVH